MRPVSSRQNSRLAAIGAALFGVLAVGAVPLSVAANAQAYPSKPITIVVPFGAGSGTDMISRIVAQHLGSKLKQSIVVENKPGANGMIAATFVARGARWLHDAHEHQQTAFGRSGSRQEHGV